MAITMPINRWKFAILFNAASASMFHEPFLLFHDSFRNAKFTDNLISMNIESKSSSLINSSIGKYQAITIRNCFSYH